MIKGIPNGWEVVEFRCACEGEYFLNNAGKVERWVLGRKSDCVLPIIRRIEKPKKFRPFANAAEFEPHRDRWVKRLDSLGSASRISGYGDKGVVIHGDIFTFNGLFHDHTFDDGTPFGIEVTE